MEKIEKNINDILLVETFKDAIKEVNELAKQLAKRNFNLEFNEGIALDTTPTRQFIKVRIEKKILY